MTSPPPLVSVLAGLLLCGALAEDVVMSIVLHRHGARGPETCFPPAVDPNCPLWPDGKGLLTELGSCLSLSRVHVVDAGRAQGSSSFAESGRLFEHGMAVA